MPFRIFQKTEVETDGPQAAVRGPEVLKEGPLLARWYIMYRLEEEIDRARRYARPLSIAMAAPPTQFVGPLPIEMVDAATEAAGKAARTTDLLGWLSNDSFLMIMPETAQTDAQTAVARWRNEMWMRNRRLGGHKWKVVLLPDAVQFETVEQFAGAMNELLEERAAA